MGGWKEVDWIKIPDTELELSPIGLGTVNAGLAWDGEEGERILNGYLDGGGNVIDTAHVYSDWVAGERSRAERVIGDWIRRRGRRAEFVLMTKGGHPSLDAMGISRLSREELREDLDASLMKLGTDYIDIYFYHRDDERRSVEELIANMEELKKAGKIRHYACSNWKTARMKEADQYCRKHGLRGFVANQAMYNIGAGHMEPMQDVTMAACDKEMLDYHRFSKNVLMPYKGICGGFFHLLKSRGSEGVKGSCYDTEGNRKLAEGIYALCDRKGYTVTQALMGFFAVQGFPMLPLVGADDEGQLGELEEAMRMEFDRKDYGFLEDGS